VRPTEAAGMGMLTGPFIFGQRDQCGGGGSERLLDQLEKVSSSNRNFIAGSSFRVM
jgi:hypothetical protein